MALRTSFFVYLQCRVMLHGTISIEKTYGWITLRYNW
nr:MAG TPA: hypothetical protein [Caudoviricetes sp.]DAU47514.1 MAG TPA: hypothetical protein [Bacteriophage sp.]DAZ65431.1 MAG TPA: hypothetical protein [Caudoviricetes sp.]